MEKLFQIMEKNIFVGKAVIYGETDRLFAILSLTKANSLAEILQSWTSISDLSQKHQTSLLMAFSQIAAPIYLNNNEMSNVAAYL